MVGCRYVYNNQSKYKSLGIGLYVGDMLEPTV
jgi:hypothetical protein